MVNPNAQEGAEYVCRPGASPGNCAPPDTDVPGQRFNSVNIPLPAKCVHGIASVTVHERGFRKPVVNVRCAPPENEI
jgi:hypothetical protein